MSEFGQEILSKAGQSLAGAESEYLNRRFDNCANRCYFACFQAAIAALQRHQVIPRRGRWGHDYVPAQLEGQLIGRRHLYPSELRGVLERLRALRLRADYDGDVVSQTDADRALRRSRRFIAAIQQEQK